MRRDEMYEQVRVCVQAFSADDVRLALLAACQMHVSGNLRHGLTSEEHHAWDRMAGYMAAVPNCGV